MKNIIVIIGTFLMLSACHDDSHTFELAEGTYEGTFVRSNPYARFLTANVVITFNDKSFEGNSTIEKYPSICRGTYNINESTIEFYDSCTWTADFDWTLILSGKYDLTISGEEIFITRSYEGEVIDNYSLKRR